MLVRFFPQMPLFSDSPSSLSLANTVLRIINITMRDHYLAVRDGNPKEGGRVIRELFGEKGNRTPVARQLLDVVGCEADEVAQWSLTFK